MISETQGTSFEAGYQIREASQALLGAGTSLFLPARGKLILFENKSPFLLFRSLLPLVAKAEVSAGEDIREMGALKATTAGVVLDLDMLFLSKLSRYI